jgi:hypothetical protein
MVIAGLRRIPPALRLAALGLLWVGGTVSAQGIRTTYHLSLRLMDLSFTADTVSGLQVLMRPSVRSKQSKEPNPLVSLRFHPDTVLEWINHAAMVLRVPAPNAQADGIQWSRALLPWKGNGAIADSIAGWRAEMDGADADSLLKLLMLVGSQSRVDRP